MLLLVVLLDVFSPPQPAAFFLKVLVHISCFSIPPLLLLTVALFFHCRLITVFLLEHVVLPLVCIWVVVGELVEGSLVPSRFSFFSLFSFFVFCYYLFMLRVLLLV